MPQSATSDTAGFPPTITNSVVVNENESPFQTYWRNATSDDRFAAALLVLPVALCFHWAFRMALPFWLLGAAQGYLTYPWSVRHPQRSKNLVFGLIALAILGNALLQADIISSQWTVSVANGLLYSLAIPAGLNFHSVESREPADDAISKLEPGD